MSVQIHSSWKKILKSEFKKPYFEQLTTFLNTEKAQGKTILPPGSLIFNAFEQTHFDDVRVVILGQDPYHKKGQAHGLSFSVTNGVPYPPSLQNILKELKSDIGLSVPEKKGDLTCWAKQGVLLLNASLTVRESEPLSHEKYGWMNFTDAVISALSEQKKDIVFLLWGKFAQQKADLIHPAKHHILTAAHPSPLSAYKGFLGCKHFSKTNQLLMKSGLEPIDWKIV
jgi:uracil-DNA glycosylase